jgi:hydroxymethylpyrimidine pyrophosphatase-like HAD family hydrolase
MADHRLILATDLDGTFLGGDADQRRALYDFLESRRERLLLVYVTGRDLDFIDSLKSAGEVPAPDYVIGDVGTTVVTGDTFDAVDAVQDPISALWGDSSVKVRAMLDQEPGLKLQPGRFDRRVSYYYDPATLRPEAMRKVEQAGLQWLTSADTYFDVLPPGISKGPTLLRFLDTLGLDAERCLVAGDTMNDLSLFETGLKGVAVGNSEPRLKAELHRFPRTYSSPHPGCAGILDAIEYFEFKLEG